MGTPCVRLCPFPREQPADRRVKAPLGPPLLDLTLPRVPSSYVASQRRHNELRQQLALPLRFRNRGPLIGAHPRLRGQEIRMAGLAEGAFAGELLPCNLTQRIPQLLLRPEPQHAFRETLCWSAVLSRYEGRGPLCSRASTTSFCLADVDCCSWGIVCGDMLSQACNFRSVFDWEPLPWLLGWWGQPKPNCCGRHDPNAHNLGRHIGPSDPITCLLHYRGSWDVQLGLAVASCPPAQSNCHGKCKVCGVFCLTRGRIDHCAACATVRRPVGLRVYMVTTTTQCLDLRHIGFQCLLLLASPAPAASVIQGASPLRHLPDILELLETPHMAPFWRLNDSCRTSCHRFRELREGEVNKQVRLFDSLCISSCQGRQTPHGVFSSLRFGATLVPWDSHFSRSAQSGAINCPDCGVACVHQCGERLLDLQLG